MEGYATFDIYGFLSVFEAHGCHLPGVASASHVAAEYYWEIDPPLSYAAISASEKSEANCLIPLPP